VSLHDGIGDERGRYLSASEPSPIKARNSSFGGIDGIKFDVDVALPGITMIK